MDPTEAGEFLDEVVMGGGRYGYLSLARSHPQGVRRVDGETHCAPLAERIDAGRPRATNSGTGVARGWSGPAERGSR